MNRQDMRETVNAVAYLAGCAVRQTVPDARMVESMNLDLVYEAAEAHLLTSVVGIALDRAGIQDERFIRAVARAQQKAVFLDADRAQVLDRLEKAGIWYMPLKGAVLKNLYPAYGMREMADNDILFDKDRAGDVRKIMTELGFETDAYERYHHDVYKKKPASNFEMHRLLFSAASQKELYDYYLNVKDRLVPDAEHQFGYQFTDEDFYIYMTAHEYEHYTHGGIGLRSLLDCYVYLRARQIDMVYVARETKKMNMSEFERKNRSLAVRLYDGEALSAEEEEMLDYMISSGAYGTAENDAEYQVAEMGRWKYFLSRVNMPKTRMYELFPVLKRAPYLYPFFWLLRFPRGLILKNGYFRAQMKAILGLNRKRK